MSSENKPVRTGRRKSKRIRNVIISAVAVVVVAVGATIIIQSLNRDTASAGGADAEERELVYSDLVPLTDLQAGSYTSGILKYQLADTLLYLNASGEIEPFLAEEWSVSDDGLTYSFRLKEGVTFSDGTPVDAEAVKKNFDQNALGDEAKGAVKLSTWTNYGSTEVIDDHNLEVHLTAPNLYFPLLQTSPNFSPILSPATLELNFEDQRTFENFQGSGPFTFVSEVPGESITLERREGYTWGPESISTEEATAKTLVFRSVQEVGLRAGALTSGQTDIVRGLQPSDEESIEKSDGFQLYKTRTPWHSVNYAYIRINNPSVEDVRVRQALNIGFDREELVSTVLTDSYRPATGLTTDEFRYGSGGFADELAYDPDRANELLDEAGWTERDSEGYRTKNGERLSITAFASNQSVTVRPAMEFIETQWRELGVELINYTNDNTFATTATDDPSVEIGVSRNLILSVLSTIQSSSFIEDEKLTSLIQDHLAATSDEEAKETYATVERYLSIDEVIAIPLFEETQVQASRADITVAFNGWTYPALYAVEYED